METVWGPFFWGGAGGGGVRIYGFKDLWFRGIGFMDVAGVFGSIGVKGQDFVFGDERFRACRVVEVTGVRGAEFASASKL